MKMFMKFLGEDKGPELRYSVNMDTRTRKVRSSGISSPSTRQIRHKSTKREKPNITESPPAMVSKVWIIPYDDWKYLMTCNNNIFRRWKLSTWSEDITKFHSKLTLKNLVDIQCPDFASITKTHQGFYKVFIKLTIDSEPNLFRKFCHQLSI